jgi:hypothetical protein
MWFTLMILRDGQSYILVFREKVYLGFCYLPRRRLNTLDNRAFFLTRPHLIFNLYTKASNIHFTPPAEVISVESSPEIENPEPTRYDRMKLKHQLLSCKPRDLRTKEGQRWKEEFTAAGSTGLIELVKVLMFSSIFFI